MKILITGGAGFIGSHVAQRLSELDHEIMVIDDLSTGHKDNLKDINVEFIELPLDTSAAHFTIQSFEPDVVVHLAAQPSLLESIAHPRADANINIMSTLRLMESLKFSNDVHFIFSSTSAIYSDESSGNALSPYGLSKLTAESYIRLLMGRHTIFRLANIYGPRQRRLGANQIVPHAMTHILGINDFVVHSEGRHERDYLYVDDVCKAIVYAIDYEEYGTFNLASGESISVKQLLEEIKEVSEWQGEWEYNDHNDITRPRVVMDNTIFLEHFKDFFYTPRLDGLRKTWEWHKEYYA